jgi:hypothetical protein
VEPLHHIMQMHNNCPPPLSNQTLPPNLSNFTASIPLASSLFDVFKSKIVVTLADAITNATKSLGPNSTALSGSVQTERGFLIYKIAVLDSKDNTIHMILVDPANGKVLSQRQWPAAMSKTLSEIPGAGPQPGFPDGRVLPGIDSGLRIP